MSLPPLVDLGVFMGLVLAFALFGLTASGHFPAEHRATSLRAGAGVIILWATIAAALAILGAALLMAIDRLPLYASVIGGGAMLLIAPLILQGFPDSFVDGPAGLLTFSAMGLLLVAAARFTAA